MKEQDTQCAYDVILWDIRVMFVPPWQCKKPCTISSEEALMVILYRRQQYNVIRNLCKVSPYFV